MHVSQLIPFNKPHFFGSEVTNIQQALASGHISGNGAFTKACEQWLESRLTLKRALLTTSCTDALEMSSLLLDLEPGDEVIVPSFTFVSTANAFVLHGARPVFADIRRDTLNIDHDQLESLITPRTRAIVVVHYAGVSCEMDTIISIARRHGLVVIEDNAHGLFGKYKGRDLGAIGNLGTLSFHETKNISCGEGGALLINDDQLVTRSEVLRDKGTNRSQFYRGLIDKYTWVDKGSSFLPSDLLAAVLHTQLDHSNEIQEKRKQLWLRYANGLTSWASGQGVTLPFVPSHCEQAYHMFYMLLPSLNARQQLIEHLKKHQIHAVFHYVPLDSSPMGRNFTTDKQRPCPVSEWASDRILRLPYYFSLSDSEQERIISCIREFQC